MHLLMLLPLDLLWGDAETTSLQLAPRFATAIDNTKSCSPRWQLLLTLLLGLFLGTVEATFIPSAPGFANAIAPGFATLICL